MLPNGIEEEHDAAAAGQALDQVDPVMQVRRVWAGDLSGCIDDVEANSDGLFHLPPSEPAPPDGARDLAGNDPVVASMPRVACGNSRSWVRAVANLVSASAEARSAPTTFHLSVCRISAIVSAARKVVLPLAGAPHIAMLRSR